MGQKDLTEKSLEFYPDVFADVINALLYQGDQVLRAQNLQAAPTETLYHGKQGGLRNQFHDVSKYEMDNDKIRAQYTLENESVVKRKTILRRAGYAGAVYREQYGGKDIFPFVSITLFWGKGGWNAPKSLHQLFKCGGKQKKIVDNMRLNIYEMAYLPKSVRDCFSSDMRIVVDYLAEGKEYIPSNQRIVHLEELLLMLKALTGDTRYEEILPAMQEEQKKAGGVSMCELLDKYENRGMEKGMARVNELIKCLLRDGRNGEIETVVSDEAYQKRLFGEYGI